MPLGRIGRSSVAAGEARRCDRLRRCGREHAGQLIYVEVLDVQSSLNQRFLLDSYARKFSRHRGTSKAKDEVAQTPFVVVGQDMPRKQQSSLRGG